MQDSKNDWARCSHLLLLGRRLRSISWIVLELVFTWTNFPPSVLSFFRLVSHVSLFFSPHKLHFSSSVTCCPSVRIETNTRSIFFRLHNSHSFFLSLSHTQLVFLVWYFFLPLVRSFNRPSRLCSFFFSFLFLFHLPTTVRLMCVHRYKQINLFFARKCRFSLSGRESER